MGSVLSTALRGYVTRRHSLARRDLNPSLTIYRLLDLAKTCNSSMPQFLYLVMRLVLRMSSAPWCLTLGHAALSLTVGFVCDLT